MSDVRLDEFVTILIRIDGALGRVINGALTSCAYRPRKQGVTLISDARHLVISVLTRSLGILEFIGEARDADQGSVEIYAKAIDVRRRVMHAFGSFEQWHGDLRSALHDLWRLRME